jgi:hypothetical protein
MTYGSLRDGGPVWLSLSFSSGRHLSRFVLADCAVRSDRAPPPKKALVTINRRDARRKLLKANQRAKRLHARLCGSVG